MLFHRSWICDGIPKDGNQYPGGYKLHKPHKNHGAYCEICWKPRSAMIPPKKPRPRSHHKDVLSEARMNASRKLLLYSNLQLLLILGVPTTSVILAFYIISNSVFKPAIALDRTYENISYGIQIKYPEGWGEQEQQDRTVTGDIATFFPKARMEIDDCQPSLMIDVDDFTQEAPSVEQYKKSVIAKIYSLNPNTNIVDESALSTTLANSSAYKLVYTRKEDKCNLQVMEVGTVKNNRAYYITYRAEVNNYDKFLGHAEEMIKSFAIVDVKK